MTGTPTTAEDPEIAAISIVYDALRALEPDAQSRVLAYVAGKLKLPLVSRTHHNQEDAPAAKVGDSVILERVPEKERSSDGALEGISPIAQKWMTRNSLQTSQLESIFSLGVDEIDLIATTVPGKNKKEKMRNVFLLKGVGAYLGTGAARFTHEQIKDTCLHYDAFDAANFAAYFKSLSSEVSGSKSEGYTLTARGLAIATELLKAMIKAGRAG